MRRYIDQLPDHITNRPQYDPPILGGQREFYGTDRHRGRRDGHSRQRYGGRELIACRVSPFS
jgi:hypothetical protein